MDTMTAWAFAQANRGNELMVFDWDKAASIIKTRNAKRAAAGLAGDWEYTGGEILNEGKPVAKEDTYTFLSSTWATPELEVDGDTIDCYKMQSEVPEWNDKTYWPQSALDIINSGM
jgi:hypothetical protein